MNGELPLIADKIAVVGDMHGHYTQLDNDHLESANFDLVLFVGDLGSGLTENGLDMIRTLSRLRVPGLVMPGNNDAPQLAHLKAELAFQSGKRSLFRLMGNSQRRGIQTCGFSLHTLHTTHGPLSLIAARPCAMGGSEFSFPELIERNHSITSIEESARRLCELVDEAPHREVIFFAHNGPSGLGERPSDPWGRDFPLPKRPEAPLDWGDSDLSEAVNYARAQGKRVLAVIGGHMHRNQRAPRSLVSAIEGTQYINAAQVPRIINQDDCSKSHFVEISIDLTAAEPLVVTEGWQTLRAP